MMTIVITIVIGGLGTLLLLSALAIHMAVQKAQER
jgi:hypothetical protein